MFFHTFICRGKLFEIKGWSFYIQDCRINSHIIHSEIGLKKSWQITTKAGKCDLWRKIKKSEYSELDEATNTTIGQSCGSTTSEQNKDLREWGIVFHLQWHQ